MTESIFIGLKKCIKNLKLSGENIRTWNRFSC